MRVCMHVSVYVYCIWLAKFLFVFIFMHETWFLELVVDLEMYNPVPTARFAAQLSCGKVSSPESFFSEAVFSRTALVSQ